MKILRKIQNLFTRKPKVQPLEPTPEPLVSTIDWEQFERGMNRDRATWLKYGIPAPKREPREHQFDLHTPIDPVLNEMWHILGIFPTSGGSTATKNPNGRKGSIHPELLKFLACCLIVGIVIGLMMLLVKLKLTWLFLILFYGAMVWFCVR